MDSPFDVLLVDPDATDEEIEQAYRERIKDAHPDHGGSVDEFQTVRRAYEKLKAGYTEPDNPQETDDAGTDSDDDLQATTEVTYLNYDILADFDWRTDDPELFENAAAADLDDEDYGHFTVEPGQTLLEAAEAHDHAWPFACRGGACVNCAIMLLDGELSMPANHVLPADMMDAGIRLSCNAVPITSELHVLYNVKHMPELDDLLLPPKPYKQAYPTD